MDIKRKAALGVKWTSTSTVVLALNNLLKIAILARLLDKSDFGLMALVMFVLGFMNLFVETGIPTAILHKQKITKLEYSSLYWLNLIISLTLYAIIYLVSPVRTNFYKRFCLQNI